MNIVKRLIFLALLVCSLGAHAAPVRWVSNRVDYTTNGQDVKEVLRDLAASQGITARISKDVSGTVRGEFHMPPQRFLETLASTFGFVWYYDGSILHVVPPDDVKSTLVRLNHATMRDLRDVLTSTGVLDTRFRITYDSRQKTVIVTGPQAYVSLVQSVAERLDEEARHRSGTVIRVYPLKHAWAMDRTVALGGSSVFLPGVAKVLSGMFHPDEGGGKAIPRGDAMGDISNLRPMNNAVGMPGNGPLPGLAGNMPNSVLGGLAGTPSPALENIAGARGTAPPLPGGSQDLPVIRPDQRTNSVLVRDTPDRMYQYAELIERLDVKPRLIEIEAHIIDIEEGALRQLGVDWRIHSSRFDFQTGTGGAQNAFDGRVAPNFGTVILPGGGAVAAAPVGASISAVVGDAGRYIMTRISALQQDNRASIQASPKVTTLDNLEARMDNNQQFFVRVAGFAASNLFTVTTGVSLNVLPMVVQDTERVQVKMDVVIQDGRITGQSVDNIPVITSTNITTSAFINEGQSLLIAGYKVNQTEEGETGVPFLSDIPLIGALFRHKTNTSAQRERLFLLTPRVINL
ncbi:Type III secretion outermembrane pore forming protein (YscC,MxiD,HrcC, InvG) [plant metagenome]|uniref:Type III secretion outermembrane pore forming protein (YscC,MxiD,HrcC, InvG) n=1 Tax=plant metagenome TaxID=1297885 RepID=A0A484VE01_9ZZZZ